MSNKILPVRNKIITRENRTVTGHSEEFTYQISVSY